MTTIRIIITLLSLLSIMQTESAHGQVLTMTNRFDKSLILSDPFTWRGAKYPALKVDPEFKTWINKKVAPESLRVVCPWFNNGQELHLEGRRIVIGEAYSSANISYVLKKSDTPWLYNVHLRWTNSCVTPTS